MPEIKKVISKQGHSNRIYVAHILGSPKVYVNDRSLQFQRSNYGHAVLTLTNHY